jgi:hypothetical protein
MRLTALAFVLLLLFGNSVRSEWEMVCVEDPDYVTLVSVLASYGLSTSARSHWHDCAVRSSSPAMAAPVSLPCTSQPWSVRH